MSVMKKYALLIAGLLIASIGMAQRAKPQVQQTQHQSVLINANHAYAVKAIAADLVPYPPAQLNSNGKRYIKAFTVNQGKSKSKSCYLKVTYKWKFDYELFTKKELVKTYTINPLNPNEATSVIFEVPDSQIKSNQPYGSKYVSITLEVDGTNIVFEQDEKNNKKSLSLPILP